MTTWYHYDEDGIYRDADIEVAEGIRRGRYLATLEKQGVCIHDGVVGISDSGEIFYPEQVGLTGTQVRCWDCGTVFASTREWTHVIQSL